MNDDLFSLPSSAPTRPLSPFEFIHWAGSHPHRYDPTKTATAQLSALLHIKCARSDGTYLGSAVGHVRDTPDAEWRLHAVVVKGSAYQIHKALEEIRE